MIKKMTEKMIKKNDKKITKKNDKKNDKKITKKMTKKNDKKMSNKMIKKLCRGFNSLVRRFQYFPISDFLIKSKNIHEKKN